MFCDEPVLCSYRGIIEGILGADEYLDCYHELTYHVTAGFRIVLETENFYISLDINGAELYKKRAFVEEIARQGEYFEPFHYAESGCEGTDYEYILFVDERLRSVEKDNSCFRLKFDDFELKLVPHNLGEDNFPTLSKQNQWSYNYVLGYETRLLQRCSCGGKGELLLDFVSDYVIRCSKCKKSTFATMNVQEAIDEWNMSKNPCDLTDICIE